MSQQPLGYLRRRLVIRSDSPVRRWLLPLIVVVMGVVAAWLMYEYGRMVAGFDGRAAASERAALVEQLDAQKRQLHELRVQLAAGEETRLAQVRERSEVARSIGDLQAQLARAQQDLQFYRAIASPKAASGTAVAVNQFTIIARGTDMRHFLMRFALARESRQELTVSGQVLVTVDGERAGSAASVDLAAISDTHAKQLPFSFRYFSSIEHPITLPEDFKPARVTFEVRLANGATAPYRKTFVWNPGN